MVFGNRFRTVEFVPTAACEGVSVNSCGQPVYCLPDNAELRFTGRAATTMPGSPQASVPADGITDMAGNSFDGNGNGAADGPADTDNEYFSVNDGRRKGKKDSVRVTFAVGSRIDLTPPSVVNIDPKSAAAVADPENGVPGPTTPYDQGGPSRVPATTPISILWDKTLRMESLRSGGYDEGKNSVSENDTTVALRADERKKAGGGNCVEGSSCNTQPVEPPYFYLSSTLAQPDDMSRLCIPSAANPCASRVDMIHRPFATQNELGFGPADTGAPVPVYQPVLLAKIQDTHQNCFYPSIGYSCPSDVMERPALLGQGGSKQSPSCCNRDPISGAFNCPLGK